MFLGVVSMKRFEFYIVDSWSLITFLFVFLKFSNMV